MMPPLTDLISLAAALPEDIARLKAAGELEQAEKLINMRLQKELPEMLRQRLLLEKEIMKRLPEQYPYSLSDAKQELRETLCDFQNEELQQFMDEGSVEWMYLHKEVRLKDDFVANLIKTREELAERVIHPEQIQGKWDNFKMLDQVIARMKQQPSVTCRFRIRSTVKIHEDKVRPGKLLQVQLPLPIEYAQVSDFKLLDVKTEDIVPADKADQSGKAGTAEVYQIAPAQSEQRTICFEGICGEKPECSVEYEYETQVKYWDWKTAMTESAGAENTEAENTWTENAETIKNQGTECTKKVKTQAAVVEADSDMQPYLTEQLPHIRFTPYLTSLTAEIIGSETDPLKKAKLIYDWITTHIMYSYVRSYFTIPQQVEFIATNRKGDCGLQALLFITICRIAGVPARWQSGLYANPLTIGCHDWAQFYIEPYGWLFADCSFGGAAYRAGDLERWDFFFGNLEPYRLPAAREYQKDFAFPKKYLRSDPYDNQSGEAEYEDMGLLHGTDFDTTHEVVELQIKQP